MRKKDLLTLALASALLLTLTACGEKTPSGSGSGSGAESTSASGSQAEQPQEAVELTGAPGAHAGFHVGRLRRNGHPGWLVPGDEQLPAHTGRLLSGA